MCRFVRSCYTWRITYCDVLGMADFKIVSRNHVFICLDILYTAVIRKNLVSVSVLDEKGEGIKFSSSHNYGNRHVLVR